MAAARPGPIPQRIPLNKTIPPEVPDWLTPTQRLAWDELTSNPLISAQDESVLHSYMRTLALNEQAYESLCNVGLMITGYRNSTVLNPAYRAFKETQQTLLTLRAALCATPAARLKAAQSTTVLDDEPANELELD